MFNVSNQTRFYRKDIQSEIIKIFAGHDTEKALFCIFIVISAISENDLKNMLGRCWPHTINIDNQAYPFVYRNIEYIPQFCVKRVWRELGVRVSILLPFSFSQDTGQKTEHIPGHLVVSFSNFKKKLPNDVLCTFECRWYRGRRSVVCVLQNMKMLGNLWGWVGWQCSMLLGRNDIFAALNGHHDDSWFVVPLVLMHILWTQWVSSLHIIVKVYVQLLFSWPVFFFSTFWFFLINFTCVFLQSTT